MAGLNPPYEKQHPNKFTVSGLYPLLVQLIGDVQVLCPKATVQLFAVTDPLTVDGVHILPFHALPVAQLPVTIPDPSTVKVLAPLIEFTRSVIGVPPPTLTSA
jgi:hypothetical protein